MTLMLYPACYRTSDRFRNPSSAPRLSRSFGEGPVCDQISWGGHALALSS
jgi:hypothetical protein